MRSHQSKWIQWLTALIAGIGLAVGGVACDSGEEDYGGTTSEPREYTMGGQLEGEQQADQQGQIDEEQIAQEERQIAQDEQQTGQQEGEQQLQPNEELVEVGEVEPSDISDEDLATYARLQLMFSQGEQGATGGGPVGDQQLSEQQVNTIEQAGMRADRYLAIRNTMEDNEELQQRYERILQQMHSGQDLQLQQGQDQQPNPGQNTDDDE